MFGIRLDTMQYRGIKIGDGVLKISFGFRAQGEHLVERGVGQLELALSGGSGFAVETEESAGRRIQARKSINSHGLGERMDSLEVRVSSVSVDLAISLFFFGVVEGHRGETKIGDHFGPLGCRCGELEAGADKRFNGIALGPEKLDLKLGCGGMEIKGRTPRSVEFADDEQVGRRVNLRATNPRQDDEEQTEDQGHDPMRNAHDLPSSACGRVRKSGLATFLR